MKPKTLLQAIGTLLVMMTTIGLYFYWTTPLLRFASDGVKDHIPTQIFVLIIRIMAYGHVSGVLCLGVYFTYQFKLRAFFTTLFIGLWILLVGIGMRTIPSAYLIIYLTLPSILLAFFRKRIRAAIIDLQNTYGHAEPQPAPNG